MNKFVWNECSRESHRGRLTTCSRIGQYINSINVNVLKRCLHRINFLYQKFANLYLRLTYVNKSVIIKFSSLIGTFATLNQWIHIICVREHSGRYLGCQRTIRLNWTVNTFWGFFQQNFQFTISIITRSDDSIAHANLL